MEACLANPPFPYYGVDGSRSGDAKKRLVTLHSVLVNPTPAKLQIDIPAVRSELVNG
jgi:hypothetical protein